jgi:hypothetical protein
MMAVIESQSEILFCLEGKTLETLGEDEINKANLRPIFFQEIEHA